MNSAQRAIVVLGLLTVAAALVIRPYEHVALVDLAQTAVGDGAGETVRLGFFPFWDVPTGGELHLRALLLIHGTIATLFCLAMAVAAPMPKRRGSTLMRPTTDRWRNTARAAYEPTMRHADTVASKLHYEMR